MASDGYCPMAGWEAAAAAAAAWGARAEYWEAAAAAYGYWDAAA